MELDSSILRTLHIPCLYTLSCSEGSRQLTDTSSYLCFMLSVENTTVFPSKELILSSEGSEGQIIYTNVELQRMAESAI